MEVEPFKIEDYEELLSLWNRTGLPFDREDRDSLKSLERQVLDDHIAILVLKDEGRLIGSVVASSDGRKGWINRLAVEPEYRGRRLASLLLEEAERFFRESGINIIAALIEDDNTPSMVAFRRSGYEAWPPIVYFRKKLK